MQEQEKDKEFKFNENWEITTYAIVSALIFYGIFLTVAIITDLPEILNISGAVIPIFAIISTMIYFIIYKRILQRAKKKE